jgi:hypothetical protein
VTWARALPSCAESRYNRDNDTIIGSYSIGMDVLSVFVETSNLDEGCLNWQVMNAVERFESRMRRVDGVQSVSTVSGLAKIAASSNNEGNPRWAALQRTEAALRSGAKALSPDLGLNTELQGHQSAGLPQGPRRRHADPCRQ